MAEAVVEIRGLSRFRSTLKRAGADMADMKAVNQRVGDMVALVGASQAPRRSGNLAASLRGARQVARARAYSDVIYAGPIHWGWPARNIRAQQFLLSAAIQTQPHWLALYERELQRIANSVQGA